MTITITDLFCGAGGSSSGATALPGVRVRMAANHWKLAIETHNSNHPDTDHDCADISQVRPERYPRTDVLWASPECTNHSQAKGKKRATPQAEFDFGDRPLPDEAAERSRATMWDVPRFAEYHRYRAVIVENVVDAANWVLFPAWLMAMQSLGYEHELVWLNSMHAQAMGAPAPQSRDRMYVVFWQHGVRRPDIEKWTRPNAWCPEHGHVRALQSFKKAAKWGRYKAQYVYRCPRIECRNRILEPAWLPAYTAIDWTIPGQRIGDRQKPLAPKTRARIEAGLRRYARATVVEAAGNSYDAADPKHPQHGLTDGYMRAWPVDDPFRTLHTTASKAVAGHPDAFMVMQRSTNRATAITEPLATFTTGLNHALLVPVEGRDGKTAVPAEVPMRTQSTRNETALVIPLRNNNTVKPVTETLDTIAANGNHHALLMRNNSERGATGGMTTPVEEPMRTLTTGGHVSLLEADDIDVDDCLFRMLEPDEIKRGMAFSEDYLLLGTKREQVKLAGNAVTPPAARDLIAAVCEALGHDVTVAA